MNATVLVTGGTGFVGIHTILQLLQQGYTVKTTLRSLSKKDTIIQALNEAGIIDFTNLSFYQAELTADAGWEEAVARCDYVLHIASPFPAQAPKEENELIIPARDGALRVLRAAKEAGVKRVVLTSSFAAIGYTINPQGHVFTEKDWTDPASDKISAYVKSKTIAELAAWEFIEKQGGSLELTVINPVGIFGPVLGKDYSASVELVKNILTGASTESPPFSFGVVDVRDVADIHIKAMLNPEAKGERFLATSDGVMTFYDIAQLLKAQKGGIAQSVSNLTNPNVSYITLSNDKAKTVLGWQPRSKEEAILATVESLFNVKST
ncbi:aldehyde reductase [Spirosoma knui]